MPFSLDRSDGHRPPLQIHDAGVRSCFGRGHAGCVRPVSAAQALSHADPDPDRESEPDGHAVANTDPDAVRAAQADGHRDDFQWSAIQVESRH